MSVPLLALLLDLVFGDPPNRAHPVAWMGRWIGGWQTRTPRQGRAWPLLAGLGILLSGVGGSALVGCAVERVSARLPRPLALLLRAAALKATFSLRGLVRAADDVRRALVAGDLPAARHWLGWHLVSRETRDLSPAQVAAATVESLAENASDGVIAPLLYAALGGLPAALAYRFVNTADAMLGYRDPEHEWLGKVPARADDVLNALPARTTAGLIVLITGVLTEDARRAWRVWRRDAGRTASPNAGHPMAAMAGALGVELEKVGHYRLGQGLRAATAEDIARAQRIVWGVGVLAALLASLLSARRGGLARRARRCT